MWVCVWVYTVYEWIKHFQVNGSWSVKNKYCQFLISCWLWITMSVIQSNKWNYANEKALLCTGTLVNRMKCPTDGLVVNTRLNRPSESGTARWTLNFLFSRSSPRSCIYDCHTGIKTCNVLIQLVSANWFYPWGFPSRSYFEISRRIVSL